MSETAFELEVKLFATLKDLAGTDRLRVNLLAEATVDDLRQKIITDYPALREALPSAIAAVNHEYVLATHTVTPTDEVAFFPPVSGGSHPEVFQLTDQAIDLNVLTQQIVTPATGAITLFSGYVRGETQTDDGAVQTDSLHYEAYEPMAIAKMKQVADEIRRQWPDVQGIAIVQRIGHLQVGEPTILIACAAGHRDQGCFEAAHYGINRLKEIVPIWKKEISPNGDHWVEGHYRPTPDDHAG